MPLRGPGGSGDQGILPHAHRGLRRMRRPSLSEGILGGDQTSQPARSFSAWPPQVSQTRSPPFRTRAVSPQAGQTSASRRMPPDGPRPWAEGRKTRLSGAAPSNSPLPTLRCRQLGMVSGDLGNVCLQRPRLGPHPTLSGRSLRPLVPQPLSSRWRAPPHPARHCP